MRRLGFLLVLALAAPAMAIQGPPGKTSDYSVLVAYRGRVAVIDPNAADDWGTIPLDGTVEAATLVRDRGLLLVHAPDASTLAMIDVRPFVPSRFQVVATYRSPELGRHGLRFVHSGVKWYLADGDTAVAIIDPARATAQLGLYAFDFLPLVYLAAQHVRVGHSTFALKDGQLTVEDPRPRGQGVYAPEYIRLDDRPLEMVADPPRGRLYVSVAKPDGTGALVVVDAAAHRPVRELPVPFAITSLVWLENGTLCMLSAPQRRLALYDLAQERWIRVWSPSVSGIPARLLALGAPPPALPPPLPDDLPTEAPSPPISREGSQ